MKRKIPSQVMIGNRKIRVIVKKLKQAHAEYDSDDYAVYIDPATLAREDCDSYIFHELVHAALHISGVDNVLDIKQEEAICWALQHLLYPVYRK